MPNIFDTALYGMIALFTIIVIFMISVFVIGGYLFPMFTSDTFAPKVTDAGVTRSSYFTILNYVQTAGDWTFYIIIGTIFAFLVVKFFYEKEDTSVNIQ